MTPVLVALFRACHPGPTFVVTLIAVCLAIGLDQSSMRTGLIGVTVFVGQLSIGWSNDWLDEQADRQAYRLDKPSVSGQVSAEVLRRSALAALIGCALLSVANGLAAAVAHAVLLGSGWCYNLWLKPTLLSWLPYALGFAALPAFVWLSAVGSLPEWWQMTAGGLLGVGAHFANVLPDLERDRESDIDGLPQHLGLRRSAVVAFAVLAAGAVLVVAMSNPPVWVGVAGIAVVTVLVVVGLWSTRAKHSVHQAFLCAMGVALVSALLFVSST